MTTSGVASPALAAIGVLLLGFLGASTGTVLIYLRYSKRQLEARMKRLEAGLGEIASLVRLQEPVFSRPLPWTSWTLSASCLLRIRDSFSKRPIQTVVECGAGISSLHIARLLAPQGGRLIALEDDELWARAIQRLADEEGLSEVVTVLYKPLIRHEVLGHEVRWYDVRSPSDLDLEAIDLLLVDGPPGVSGPMARLPALPILAPAMSAGSEIFLDDAQRPEEQEVLRLWKESYPLAVETLRGARPFARLVLEPQPGSSET